MADPVVVGEETDVVMEGDNIDAAEGLAEDAAGDGLPGPGIVDTPARTSFLEYLKSPIVSISVGKGPDLTILKAHKDLLTRSPYFEQLTAGSVSTIELPDDDVEAVGSVIEYLYLGDYFPRSIRDGGLEKDPSLPDVDSRGEHLLKHARIYTLAGRFKMPKLQSVAHSKIHQTTSTAAGEINYARFVYAHTSTTDSTIRAPVAAFWATRSHVLRHEAEEEFRAMCLEFPQFAFDVLSKVLDQKEKRQGGQSGGVATGGPSVSLETPSGRGKKRARLSGV